MGELLKQFSIEQILLFIVLGAAAIKGVVSWIDWARDRVNKGIDKRDKIKNKENEIEKKIEQLIQSQETMKGEIGACQIQLKDTINEIKDSIDLLMESDKDDIKAWITEKHHYFCYQLKCIDDYNLDCIEKRFNHYQHEGGNSFVEQLMEEIRALPKTSNIRLEIEKRDNR